MRLYFPQKTEQINNGPYLQKSTVTSLQLELHKCQHNEIEIAYKLHCYIDWQIDLWYYQQSCNRLL